MSLYRFNVSLADGMFILKCSVIISSLVILTHIFLLIRIKNAFLWGVIHCGLLNVYEPFTLKMETRFRYTALLLLHHPKLWQIPNNAILLFIKLGNSNVHLGFLLYLKCKR